MALRAVFWMLVKGYATIDPKTQGGEGGGLPKP
jgi:hypothetical protein